MEKPVSKTFFTCISNHYPTTNANQVLYEVAYPCLLNMWSHTPSTHKRYYITVRQQVSPQ